MPDVPASPRYTLLRTIAAPVLPDANDIPMAQGILTRGFQYVSLYWTGAGAADTDLLTLRVLFLDEQCALNPLLGLIWLRSVSYQLQRGVRLVLPVRGERVQVRVDAFSNPAVPCNVFVSGVG